MSHHSRTPRVLLSASLGAILITSDGRLRRAAAGIVAVADPDE